ncbi:hypothetical protein RISK_002870 [Rhodopirellula islandica]|uniref:Uncharacterized protein n=1 Tax=Rhodopirellula islandica TaxID=595434 RepID=A0A0J1BEU2_RHOIS|nr:hypothetical protein RISK_002870 [Rhodopirellula islandica]
MKGLQGLAIDAKRRIVETEAAGALVAFEFRERVLDDQPAQRTDECFDPSLEPVKRGRCDIAPPKKSVPRQSTIPRWR